MVITLIALGIIVVFLATIYIFNTHDAKLSKRDKNLTFCLLVCSETAYRVSHYNEGNSHLRCAVECQILETSGNKVKIQVIDINTTKVDIGKIKELILLDRYNSRWIDKKYLIINSVDERETNFNKLMK